VLAILYPPGRFVVLISVRGLVDTRAIVWLEGLGKLKNSTSLGLKPVILTACSIVPQPTTIPHATKYKKCQGEIIISVSTAFVWNFPFCVLYIV
jgi:hypothetical protein